MKPERNDHHGSEPGVRAVLIAGPTASGKSALALSLAAQWGGVIVNADSMQVYRDLKVITARPTSHDEAIAPHRLYGHVDAAQTYSVGRWLADIDTILTDAWQNKQIPIVVGGTGLYFKALTYGLAAVPPIAPDIRAKVRERLKMAGPHALHAELAQIDPAGAAKLRPADGVRIARALEVIETTGRSLAHWHQIGLPPRIDAARAVKIFLSPRREDLYRRIDTRFDAMIEAGALDEVRALEARHLDPLHPALKAHGVPWLIKVLAGEMSLSEAVLTAKTDTRHYTKRQFTWFRRQLPDWPWIEPKYAAQRMLAELKAMPA